MTTWQKIIAALTATAVFIGAVFTAGRKWQTQVDEKSDLQDAHEYTQKEQELDDEVKYRDTR